MDFEEIKEAVLQLSGEDRVRLMREIGPALCDSMMAHPAAMAEMMQQCRQMMAGRPEMMACMGEMMAGASGPEGASEPKP